MKINTKIGDLEYQLIDGRWKQIRHRKPHKKSNYEILKKKNKKKGAEQGTVIKQE